MNHPKDPVAFTLRNKRKASRMPVSRLRPGHTGVSKRDTVDPYSVAGRLLYGRIIRDYPIGPTMEQIIEREGRQRRRSVRLRSRRNTSTVSWEPAGPKSREAQRRTRQKLVQHPSVEARFTKASPEAVANLTALVEGGGPSGTKSAIHEADFAALEVREMAQQPNVAAAIQAAVDGSTVPVPAPKHKRAPKKAVGE